MSNPIAPEMPDDEILEKAFHDASKENTRCVGRVQLAPSGKGAEPKTKDELIEAYARLVDAYQTKYASLRQQLSDSQKESLGWAKGLADERELHGEQVRSMRKFAVDLEERLQEKVADLEKQLSEAQGKVSQLEAEVEQWSSWGVVEIAVRNQSVSDYIEHWEGRTLKAESERDSSRKDITKLVAEVDGARQDASDWKRNADMYARAWGRELGPRRHKSHLIDELVVGTRELRQRAETLTKERDEVHAANKSLTSQVSVLTKERDKYDLALHSLTAGGSEFAHDAAACVLHVKERQHSQHQVILKFKKERDEFESRLSAVSEVVRTAKEIVKYTGAEETRYDELRTALDAVEGK